MNYLQLLLMMCYDYLPNLHVITDFIATDMVSSGQNREECLGSLEDFGVNFVELGFIEIFKPGA